MRGRAAAVIPPKDEAILRGAEALGWEAAPIRRNAADCGDCGSCPFGCRRGEPSSRVSGRTSREPSRPAPGSCRASGSCVSWSRAAARSASRAGARPDPRPADRSPRPSAAARIRVRLVRVHARGRRSPRARCARRRCSRRSGLGIRRSGATCGSIPVRSSPARLAAPGRHVARHRCRPRDAWSSASGAVAATVRHRVGAGASRAARARAAVGGRRRARRRDGRARQFGAVHRGDPRRRRGPDDADAGRPRPGRLPARCDRRGDAPARARVDGPPGAGAGALRDRRRRARRRAGARRGAEATPRSTAFEAASRRSTSARTAAPCSPPTRWARSGWARDPRARLRPGGRVRRVTGAPSRRRRALRRRRRRCSRPGSASTR